MNIKLCFHYVDLKDMISTILIAISFLGKEITDVTIYE